MKEASLVRDCLPEPPTPTRRAFPLGVRMIREIWAKKTILRSSNPRRLHTIYWTKTQKITSVLTPKMIYEIMFQNFDWSPKWACGIGPWCFVSSLVFLLWCKGLYVQLNMRTYQGALWLRWLAGQQGVMVTQELVTSSWISSSQLSGTVWQQSSDGHGFLSGCARFQLIIMPDPNIYWREIFLSVVQNTEQINTWSDTYLYKMHHSIFEEYQVHMASHNSLVVTGHEQLKFLIQELKVRYL